MIFPVETIEVTVRLEPDTYSVPINIDLSNVVVDESNKCACGAESVYGCHGFRDRQLYSEYFCKGCNNK